MFCSKCGKEIDDNSTFCKYCGYKSNFADNGTSFNDFQRNTQQALYQQEVLNRLENISSGVKIRKSSTTAGLLALFFGTLGVHEFYLGNIGLGFLCIVCTVINVFFMIGLLPIFLFFIIECIVIVIRAIVLFASSDKELSDAYNKKKNS